MSGDEKGYNGWTNYETWLMALWIDNDQGLYSESRAIVKECISLKYERYEASHALKEWVESWPEIEEIQDKASFVADLFNSAFSEINWYEIAQNYISEMIEDEVFAKDDPDD